MDSTRNIDLQYLTENGAWLAVRVHCLSMKTAKQHALKLYRRMRKVTPTMRFRVITESGVVFERTFAPGKDPYWKRLGILREIPQENACRQSSVGRMI